MSITYQLMVRTIEFYNIWDNMHLKESPQCGFFMKNSVCLSLSLIQIFDNFNNKKNILVTFSKNLLYFL